MTMQDGLSIQSEAAIQNEIKQLDAIRFDQQIKEVYFGYVKYPANSQLGPRIQRGIEFVCTLSGHIDFTIESQSYSLPPGYMALMLPRKEEFYQFHPEQVTEHTWCQLDFHSLPETLIQQLEKLPKVLPMTPEIEQLVELGLAITGTQQVANQTVLFRLGEALAQYYLEIAQQAPKQRPKPLSRVVRRAIHYIQQHYAEDIKLDDLAKAACCTPNHVINQFKLAFQTTPMKYVWQCRVDRAESLLRHTQLSISDIAVQCGFASPFHFSRLFKERHDQSPSQFRKNKYDQKAV